MAVDDTIVDKLKDDIVDINKNITLNSKKLRTIQDTVDTIETGIDNVTRLTSRVDEIIKNNITHDIDYIKFLLNVSGNIIDNFPVAMTFNSSSSLVLRSPKAAYEPTMNIKVSLSFKQENEGDAILLFMGNGSDPDNNGHITIDIKDKHLRLHFKGDTGFDNIMNISKNIIKGDWYRITAER